jgi:predicted phage terminase large subunit-like protein
VPLSSTLRGFKTRVPPAESRFLVGEPSFDTPQAAAIDQLSQTIHPIIAVTPLGNKEARAATVSPQFQAGNIWIPGHPSEDGRSFDTARTPPWVQAFIQELEGFPNAAHDDQVDTMTQALNYLNQPGPRLRVLGPRC